MITSEVQLRKETHTQTQTETPDKRTSHTETHKQEVTKDFNLGRMIWTSCRLGGKQMDEEGIFMSVGTRDV